MGPLANQALQITRIIRNHNHFILASLSGHHTVVSCENYVIILCSLWRSMHSGSCTMGTANETAPVYEQPVPDYSYHNQNAMYYPAAIDTDANQVMHMQHPMDGPSAGKRLFSKQVNKVQFIIKVTKNWKLWISFVVMTNDITMRGV